MADEIEQQEAAEPFIPFTIGPKVRLSSGKIGWSLYRVLPDGTLSDQASYFLATKLKGVHTGAVYEIKATDDTATTLYLGTARFLRPWDDQEQALAWKIETRALDVSVEMERANKADAGADVIGEALAPIIRVYANALPDRKRAIEALVLAALRRG